MVLSNCVSLILRALLESPLVSARQRSLSLLCRTSFADPPPSPPLHVPYTTSIGAPIHHPSSSLSSDVRGPTRFECPNTLLSLVSPPPKKCPTFFASAHNTCVFGERDRVSSACLLACFARCARGSLLLEAYVAYCLYN